MLGPFKEDEFPNIGILLNKKPAHAIEKELKKKLSKGHIK